MNKLLYKQEFIITINNEKLKLPKVSWKKEQQAFNVISDILSAFPYDDFIKYDYSNLKVSDIIEMIPIILKLTPEYITEMVSILMTQEIAWVEDNLDSESIITILSPFFNYIYTIFKTQLKGIIQEKLPVKKKSLLKSI